MLFSRLFIVLAAALATAFFLPAVSAHDTGYYHYSHAEYAGSMSVAAPVQLYSHDSFVKPLVYQYPSTHTTVVYNSSVSPYPYPYYTAYSVPVYRTESYYSVHRIHPFRYLYSLFHCNDDCDD